MTVQETIKKIHSLNEIDYGDFKRKAGHYLNSLESYSLGQPDLVQAVRELRLEVIYNTPLDIEVAKEIVEKRLGRFVGG